MAINDPPPDGIPRKRSSSELRNIFKSRVGQVRTAIAFRRKTYNVKEDGKIDWKVKLSYGAPMFSTTSLTMLIGIHGTKFFNSLGAQLSFLAFFTALARSFDVITDPLMGWVSDATRSKYGRRKPYMAIGCIPYAITFTLLFSPPKTLSDFGVAIWFGIFYVIFYLFDTLSNVPYGALGPELSDVPEERDQLFFVAKLFQAVGTLMGAAGPVVFAWLVKKANLKDCSTTCFTDCTSLPAMWHNHTDINVLALECSQSPLDANFVNWCRCFVEDCPKVCFNRSAFTIVAAFFGCYYILAMLNCVKQVKERTISQESKQPPLVPSVNSTLTNRPFMLLLPSWALDMIVITMMGTMLPFFVTYVIEPQTLPSCLEDSSSWKCDPDKWLGLGIVALMGSTMASMPMWMKIKEKYGKREAWLAYNLVNGATNFLMILVGKHDTWLCMLFTVLNGIPAGGQFLTDSILADVIDYDEFLNGKRSEGGFTIFQTLLPKIVSIPAQAVPLAFLAWKGFIEPVNGVPQTQNEGVEKFIRNVFVLIPSTLAILSFLIKLKFPIRTNDQIKKIVEGAALHMKGLPAEDPLTKTIKTVLKIKPEEQNTKDIFDNFNLKTLEKMKQNQYHPSSVVKEMIFLLFMGVSAMFTFGAITIGTFSYLNDSSLSWIPSFCCILMGISLTWTAFSVLRLKAAKLMSSPLSESQKILLERVIDHRKGEISPIEAEDPLFLDKFRVSSDQIEIPANAVLPIE